MSSTKYPGETDEAYQDVFNINAMPPQQKDLKPGQLPPEQIRQYFEQGYLLIQDFFTKEELEPCKRDIEEIVEGLAKKLYEGGKIKDLHKDKGLFQRLTAIEQEYPGGSMLMHKLGYNSKGFQDLWSNERLLNLVEQLIGPEITGHPVWNLRPKTPNNNDANVPWHQDVAYMDNDNYRVLLPTAWIPLLDATRENGCMEVIPKGHLTGKVVRHTCCWQDTIFVEMDEQDAKTKLGIDVDKDRVLCPVPYGGLLLFSNIIPHRSLNNSSNDIRWSLDLRWQKTDQPIGFWNLKPGVVMRSKKTPVEKIDWEPFNAINRGSVQEEFCEKKEERGFDYDTTLIGPWMEKWEITHHNRHTHRLAAENITWHKK